MGTKEFLNEVITIVLATIVILMYPLILPTLLLLRIYRYVVQVIVGQNPKCRNILTGMDAIFGGVEPYKNPETTLIPYHFVSNTVDRNEVMRVFTDKILKGYNGTCVYPNMTEKLVRKYGYLFWWENEEFKLEDHIRYHNEQEPDLPMTKEELDDFIADRISNASFDRRRSPWEILIVRNFRDPWNSGAKSIMLFHFHHCLADGYAFTDFARKVGVRSWPETETGGRDEFPVLPLWEKLFNYFLVLVAGPYVFIRHMCLRSDRVELSKISVNQLTWKYRYHETRPLELTTLKKLKNRLNVTMTGLLLTIVAEAVRQHYEERKKASLSETHITLPTFLPGHPDQMTNHISTGKIPVIFQKGGGVIRTLNQVDQEYGKLIRSLLPLVSSFYSNVLGTMPITLHPNAKLTPITTLLISNFPGVAHHSFDIFGYEVLESGIGGKPPGNHGLVAFTVGYNGRLKVLISGDISMLPERKDGKSLIQALENIVYKLECEVDATNW